MPITLTKRFSDEKECITKEDEDGDKKLQAKAGSRGGTSNLSDKMMDSDFAENVEARADTFIRRNRWWIVGGGIVLALVIIAVVTLSLVDLSGPDAPTEAPTSFSPSTSPTTSLHPTVAPTMTPSALPTISKTPSSSSIPSLMPSTSSAPSLDSTSCSLFQPVSEMTRSQFTPFSYDSVNEYYSESAYFSATIPFGFFWAFDQITYSDIRVYDDGLIDISPGSCRRQIIVAKLFTFDGSAGSYEGSVYAAAVGPDLFVISWENVIPQGDPTMKTSYEILLFSDGRVHLRWGEGAYPNTHRLGASLIHECGDKYKGVAYPMGDPFVTGGFFTEYGVWPTNQCRAFLPNKYGYFADVIVPANFPTPRPSSSPIPSLTKE